ncbi:MAG: LacI family DNA-binding transcriptional regulator [Clostridiales bacterium]|nr:LacI family DNA-binding transcriptional regulator [Clostridiales bacterium]
MSDIAKELGISTVTVSKALSGQKGVGEQLRGRIRRLADEMGYQSPAEIRRNRQAAGSNIGVLIPKRYLDNHETFYWKLYQEVVARAKQKECFTLLEVLEDSEAMRHHLPKMAAGNKADGIIIIGKPINGYAAMLQQRWNKPVVFLDFYDADISADSVISNGFFGAYMLTNHLLSLGHKEIGYVGTLLTTASITDRYLGYTKALMEQNIPIRPEWVVDDRDAEGMNLPIVLPSPMPTAFVCNCDYIASRLIRTLREAGHRVPQDISVVGFDNYLMPGLCDIGITTYAVNIPEMARMAVRMILYKLTGQPYRSGLQMTDGYLVEKDSAAKKHNP